MVAFDDAYDELAAMEEEAERAHARAYALEKELESVRTALDAAHARIQALEGDLAAAREAAGSLRTELGGGQTSSEETASRIQTLEADLARAQAEAEGLREDFEDQLRAARDEADSMEVEAEEADRYAEALQAEVLELRAQLEQARAHASVDVARQAGAEENARVEAEETRRREAAERAQRDAEEARLREEARRLADEAAHGPRPKVPVWSDPTPIDLNTADLEELQLLPGIGRRPAERIISARAQNGGFTSIDDLYKIEEIPRDRISKIRPFVRV